MRRLIVCLAGRRPNVSSRLLELTGSLQGNTFFFFFTHSAGQLLTGPDAWLTFSNALLFLKYPCIDGSTAETLELNTAADFCFLVTV